MVNILHTDLRSKSNLHTLHKHNSTVDPQLADIIIINSLTPSRRSINKCSNMSPILSEGLNLSSRHDLSICFARFLSIFAVVYPDDNRLGDYILKRFLLWHSEVFVELADIIFCNVKKKVNGVTFQGQK